MNFLLINSNENDAFAAVCFAGNLDVVKCSEFSYGNEKPGRSPDKLINCLVKLRGKYDFNMITAISVTIGPGSFTGIRVGLALAKGIAGSLKVPIIPLNNFDFLFNMIDGKKTGTVYCMMIPAKNPEFYYAIFHNNKQETTGCLNIEEILKNLDKNTIIVGNFSNETILKHSYFTYINLNNFDTNKPEAMLKISKQYYAEGRSEKAENVVPVYVKDFEIKLQKN